MLTLFFAISALFFAHPAQAQLLPPPTAGEFELRGEFNYFNSAQNHANDGSKSDLPGGASLTTMMGTGEFVFDWTNHWRMRAGFSGGQTAADREVPPDNALENHTNAGLSDVWVGAEYWAQLGGFDLVPSAQVTYPFFRVNTDSGDPLLGEGATQLTGGAWLIYQMNDFRPFGFLGYDYRDEGRAGLMPYHAGMQWLPESGWWIQGEVRGYVNLTNDTNTDNKSLRDAYLLRVQGGSDRFYSINPSSHEVAGMVGMHLGQMGLYLGIAYPFSGKNSAIGATYTIGVTFDGTFFRPTQKVVSPAHRFNAQPDKYDESLFNAEPVVAKPKARPPPARARKTKPVVKKRPSTKTQPMPTVELLMKDTEKTLEKKSH